MEYFELNSLGDLDDGDFCILDQAPEGMGAHYSRLCRGNSAVEYFPEDAVVHMSEDREGSKLASLVGNTKSFLIVHKDVKSIIEEKAGNKNIEYFPFTIHNQNNKPHSADYCFINPLIKLDCLDIEASEVQYWKDTDKVLDVGQFILDRKKVENAPAIFRVKEEIFTYVVNEDLANAFRQKGFTNMILTKLQYANED
ncbi:hypothetical protein HCH_03481 [Hahella chejuensis KCTC 2396]|uniref:Immunity MXAN-0049 protein domain-containing protein n=1 Tax=Hahella chejuensis (strain KCTC 2396) TaxID=349521 RepID=Q2SGJ7_HAHCH|nr:DUF1629 domain-containing protein [Hahella chejuensis]ABC30227.1 hypothetical protein HCH_03481 [Hahella chejuensis KCTC 2396]